MGTWRIRLFLDPSHSYPDLLSGLGFAVSVFVFILGTISPRGGTGGWGGRWRRLAVINVPSSFNVKLALSVRVSAAPRRDCLG